jgi:hypothetical protein
MTDGRRASARTKPHPLDLTGLPAGEPEPRPQGAAAHGGLDVDTCTRSVAVDGDIGTSPSQVDAAWWWCRRCGRWEPCDSVDLCVECAYVAGSRRRSRTSARAARRA